MSSVIKPSDYGCHDQRAANGAGGRSTQSPETEGLFLDSLNPPAVNRVKFAYLYGTSPCDFADWLGRCRFFQRSLTGKHIEHLAHGPAMFSTFGKAFRQAQATNGSEGVLGPARHD